MVLNKWRTWTDPETFTVGVAEGWADAETDPTRIDWTARQAAAAIPFAVIDGRPVNPAELTEVRYGRNGLGRWGENLMADALVTATTSDGIRWLLLIERGDGHGWAVPGGSVEPGESPADASARELTEETGLAVPAERWRAGTPVYVPDPRASAEAWAVTVPASAHLGTVADLPVVVGADDARRAMWVRADSYAGLCRELAAWFGGRVFAAHVAMLTGFLDGAA
ncbi:hypothetical protein Lfu02_21390 [Longispora fulva]|uniref:ADP-ribose pyrophosphatase YjhB (NUDIX family) n=1 Tax=Longispora fulva TaxID=619741 RepID=A0A8J7GFP4_9ACTN|nr:NUDIX domain-containing protein [Longispora fulva]MBG6139848.1 ADP-ribose pyrophosphatase YjhB (NUDIX family) [Longispora fulva]GIG57767.1 hypothetical protein Lfu02_21390 [Longispora fulva]